MALAADTDFGAQMRGPSLLIWLVAAAILSFVVWARFAPLDEIVRADGELVSASRPQIVQNLEGGILAELLVAEGDVVQQGDVLARLQGTNFATRVQDLEEQLIAADIRRRRLEAEIAGATDFDVPQVALDRSPGLVASERALLAARQLDYAGKVDGARRVVAETRRELALMEDMLTREIVSLMETTKARKAHADAETRLAEIVGEAELTRATAQSEVLQELATLAQDYRVAQDQLERTVIRAPMRGVVNNLGVTTIGGVIRPGEEIFQVIPLDDELFVEAQVRPEDIAGVLPGQRATIKLSAYDYTIYGSLPGEVQFISADTFKDDRRPEAEPHYKVTLRVASEDLSPRAADIALRPGLRAQVELHTGQKTVLQYLTKPLTRGSEALREP